MEPRYVEALGRARRAATTPGTGRQRSMLAEGAAITKAVYGNQVADPPSAYRAPLRHERGPPGTPLSVSDCARAGGASMHHSNVAVTTLLESCLGALPASAHLIDRSEIGARPRCGSSLTSPEPC